MVARPLVTVAPVLALAAGGWFLYGSLWPDEPARVRAAVHALATTVTDAGQAQQGAAQFAALADLRNQLADDVTVEAAQRALLVEGRDQVLALAARFASAPTRPALSFVDVTVSLGADGATAAVSATAEFSETTAAGQQAFDAQQVELVWVKPGGTWVLRSARAIDVLR